MVKKPVRAIVEAISRAATRWSDRSFAPRIAARAVVEARTSYAPAVVDYAFDALFGQLRANAIGAIIEDELGCLDVLDDFTPRTGRPAARALPIGRVCVISSRTTIGVGIVPASFALCAKCEVVVKDREDDLADAFFSTVAQELDIGRELLQTHTWNGAVDSRRLEGFDLVVAFGSSSTLARISAQLAFPARLIGYGSKASAGYITREALENQAGARTIAARAARDLILYDTEGCLSLHTLFVERRGAVSPTEFGGMLADAIRVCQAEFPATLRHEGGARVALRRDRAMLQMAPDRLHADSGAKFLVVVDMPADEPPLFLPRAIGTLAVDDPAEAVAYLHAHGVRLEAFAVEQRRPDVIAAVLQTKPSRITRLGELQRPPLGIFHGGRPRIAEFVRWVTDERA